jgi:UDP-3-O-[3-hydroxymyristoyl] glucosamine N-acyltransferase
VIVVLKTLAELAAELGGVVVGDGRVVIRGVAGIREALPGDLTFLANTRYESHLAETRASAVICDRQPRESSIPLLQVDNPYLAFQQAVRVFRPDLHRPVAGVHPTAVIAPDAVLGEEVSIGPYCVVESGARLGARVVVMAGGYVGGRAEVGESSFLYPRVVVREECVIGARCILHPGVVIGADGFGFAFDAGRYHKVPQVGNVVIGDDVEIGANSCVDRATTDSTRIGDGSKLDNLVQIGHNVSIGRHCIVVAQVGIAGSTELEDYVTLGGQAGIAGHLRIEKGAVVAAQSGVSRSVKSKEIVSGYPAIAHGAWKRVSVLLQKLPQLFRKTKELDQRVEALERQGAREVVR